VTVICPSPPPHALNVAADHFATTPAAEETPHSWLSNCLATFRACKLRSGRVSLAEWKHTWADARTWMMGLHLDCSGPLSPLAGGLRLIFLVLCV
jgi:hypothetical protein